MSDNFTTRVDLAPAAPIAPSFGPVTVPTVAPRYALGGRAQAVAPQLDHEFLRRAAQKPSLLPRSTSPGVSDVLNEMLMQTGLVYEVDRARFNDGAGHQAGNALDVNGDDMTIIVQFLALLPTLFTNVRYQDPDYDDDRLFIVNGVITTSNPVNDYGGLHIESTRARFAAGMSYQIYEALAQAVQGSSRLVYAVSTPDIGGRVVGQGGGGS